MMGFSYIPPETRKVLSEMGGQIKLARLRRQIPASLAAERAGISRTTLCKIEKATRPYQSGIMLLYCTH